MHRSQPLATTFFAGKKIAYCVNVFFFARNTTGSPSLVYKRGVWEISFDRETRILTKIIKLQLLTLFVCLWLNPTQWSRRLKQTRSVSWSFIIFVKILVSWSNEISHTSLLYTKLVLPVEILFLSSCKLCEYIKTRRYPRDLTHREHWVSHSRPSYCTCQMPIPAQHQNDVTDVLGSRLVAFYSVSTALIYHVALHFISFHLVFTLFSRFCQ